MHLIGGIDEAGRGCLIGPMALCGVCIEKERDAELQALGVKDSKQLTPRQRDRLAELIREVVFSLEVILIPPGDIDRENLNYLSLKKSAEIIDRLSPDVVYLDVPAHGSGIQKYCQAVQRMVKHQPVRICGENKADQNYPVVSAASIIAKVARDREIHNLYAVYGDFGSGYPSDPKTRLFARQYLSANQPLPPIIRAKWKTVARLRGPRQKRLFPGGDYSCGEDDPSSIDA